MTMHTLVSTTAILRNDVYRESIQLWPGGTTVADHDILVGDRSLTALARERRTPCVLIAPAHRAAFRSGGDEHRTLVVSTIKTRTEKHRWHHPVELTLDSDLKSIAPRLLHVELLRSPRDRRLAPVIIRSHNETMSLRARLPETSSPGDLIVFACSGTIALSEIKPHRIERTADPVEDEVGGWRCMKR